MKVHCSECSREFVPGPLNTQIIGPDVLISCPFCFNDYSGKLTSYVRDQLGVVRGNSATDARSMIDLARFIELNSSDYYKKKGLRHGTKKVRNIPT